MYISQEVPVRKINGGFWNVFYKFELGVFDFFDNYTDIFCV